jgi:hypothetical protein
MVSKSPVTFQRLLAIVIVLLLCTPTPNIAAAQASDFGFRFEFGYCFTERLDTFSGVFTETFHGVPARPTVTAQMSLIDAQMRTIHRAIDKIGFFNYPSTYSGVPTGLETVGSHSPYAGYRLEVRNGGAVHTVSWTDRFTPTTAEADRLRDLFSMLLGFIHESSEYKRLPFPTVGCE